MKKLEAVDRKGAPLKAGDRVRIVGVPDLTGMTPHGIAKSMPVFEYLVGKCKRIAALDDSGYAILSFFITSGPCKGWHSISIEPHLLQLPKRRS